MNIYKLLYYVYNIKCWRCNLNILNICNYIHTLYVFHYWEKILARQPTSSLEVKGLRCSMFIFVITFHVVLYKIPSRVVLIDFTRPLATSLVTPCCSRYVICLLLLNYQHLNSVAHALVYIILYNQYWYKGLMENLGKEKYVKIWMKEMICKECFRHSCNSSWV